MDEFLLATVLPSVTQIFVDIARSRPEDPIAFMADALRQKAADVQKQAEANAYENFYKILREAEESYRK